MTPDEYVEAIQQMAQKQAYSEMLELAQTVRSPLTRLTADHVRAIEPFLGMRQSFWQGATDSI